MQSIPDSYSEPLSTQKPFSLLLHPLVSRHMKAPRNLPDRSVRHCAGRKARRGRNREAAAADGRPNLPIRHRHGQGKPGPSVDLKGALKASGRQAHHKAMPREDLPEFLRALSAYDGAARTRLALRLAGLTFVRTTELRAARWDEGG